MNCPCLRGMWEKMRSAPRVDLITPSLIEHSVGVDEEGRSATLNNSVRQG